MTVETAERNTVIHIHISGEDPTAPQVLSLTEALRICGMCRSEYFLKVRGPFGDFWKADNAGQEGTKSRFYSEHVKYLSLVHSGLMTEQEAYDLWQLRRREITNDIRNRSLQAVATPRRGGGKK